MDYLNLYQQGARIRKDEEMVRLDFSDELHRAYFLAEMGGEEYFKSTFPQLYTHYQEAAARDRNREAADAGEPDAFQDAVEVFYGFYNKDTSHLVCKGVTSLKNDAQNICQRIHVYDNAGNLVIATGSVASDSHHAVLELDAAVPSFRAQYWSALTFDFFSLWYEAENGLQAAYYSSQDELVWDAVDYVESVRMIDPIHKKTPENSPIVVCYNRSSQSGECIDYDQYEEAFDPVTHRQKLYLDTGAMVTLTQDAGEFSGIDITKFLLKLDCQSGIAQYKKEGRIQEILNKFQKTDTGFVFQLDKDWQGVVPAARLPMREPLDFLLRLEFQCDDYKKRGRLIVDSRADTSKTSGYVQPISQLHLLWGCVADDTDILMADGSRRAISKIKIGNLILSKDGQPARVTDVYRGRETEPLLCLETQSGRRLLCTKFHPLLTRSGFTAAADLTGDDEVLNEEGRYDRLTAIYPVNHENVYSLKLDMLGQDRDAAMICGGLVTGDVNVQYQLIQEKGNKGKPVNDCMTEELKKLTDFFRN